MALREFPALEQGTPEWIEQRRGIVTASVVGQLLTTTGQPARNDTSRRLTLSLVAERITGEVEPTFMNEDMWRGHEVEPIARDLYAEMGGPRRTVTTTGFLIRDDWGFQLGYSPDGLVGDHGLLEVKAPRAKGHLATILANEVPSHHMAQLQAGLLVSGREWIDFMSYRGGMPPYVKRVYADPKWAESIVDAVAAFEQRAVEMTLAYDVATRGMPSTPRLADPNTVELKLA